MNFVGASSSHLLLAGIVWVEIGAEIVVPVGAAVPILTAMAATLYTVHQLKAYFLGFISHI